MKIQLFIDQLSVATSKWINDLHLLNRPVWVLWLISLFTVIFAVSTFDGFYFYDDVNYLRYAHQLAVGSFELNFDIHNHRFGLLLPVALMLKFFGLNDFSATVWPLIATICTLFVIYHFTYRRSRFTALMAVWFFGTEYYIIYFSNKVYPDTTDTLFLLLGVMLLWKTRYMNPWYSIFPAFAFFAALLTKETIVYVGPFLIWWIVTRFQKEKDIKRHLIFVFFFTTLVFVLFNFYYFTTGDYFFLIDSVQDNHYIDRLSYYDKPWWKMLARLTYEPFLMLSDSGMAAVVILAVPKLIRGWRCLIYTRDNVESITWMYTISGLLVFWFMTTSFKHYNPIPLNPRMFFPILPGMAILAAFSLKNAVISPYWQIRYAILFSLAALIDLVNSHEKIALVYLAFAAIFYFQYYSKWCLPRELVITLLLVLTLLHPLYGMIKRHPRDYYAEKAAFELIKKMDRPLTVVCDERLALQADFYFEFEVPQGIRFQSFCDSIFQEKSDILILRNERTISYLRQYGNQHCEPPDIFNTKEIFSQAEVRLLRVETPLAKKN